MATLHLDHVTTGRPATASESSKEQCRLSFRSGSHCFGEDSSEGCASDHSLRELRVESAGSAGRNGVRDALEPTSGGGRETVPTEPAS